MKQNEIPGLPLLNLEQQAATFDVEQINGKYLYKLGKRFMVDLAAMPATDYTEVTVMATDDITWRDLAYTYMGGYQTGWWVILVFNGFFDAMKMPADYCAIGADSVVIRIPTVEAYITFLEQTRLS